MRVGIDIDNTLLQFDNYGTRAYAKLMLRGLHMRNMKFHVLAHDNISREFQGLHPYLQEQGLSPYIESAHYIKGHKKTFLDQQDMKVDVMIESYGWSARHLAKQGITVLLFDHESNHDRPRKNIIRVKSWWEVFQQLVKLQDKQKVVI